MTDPKISVFPTVSQYAGSGIAIFGAMSLNDLLAIFGVVIGFGGLLINWRYRHKALMLQEREVEARIRALERSDG